MTNSVNTQVNEILTENGLDFTIEKIPFVGIQPIVSIGLNGIENSTKEIKSPYYGLYNSKSGEFINSVKEGYTISQNAEIIEMVLKGIAPFGDVVSVKKAGSLNGGRKMFMQLAIEGTSKVGDDTIKRYVTIIDSNDGSTGLSVGTGDVTLSCSNQFYQFYREGQSKMRHTASLESKIKEIPSLIRLALSESMEMVNLYNDMAVTSINDINTHDLVKLLTGVDKRMTVSELEDISTKKTNAMNELYNQIRIEVAQKGKNVWGLHSGVTRWTTHHKSAPKRDNGRIESMMTSTNYRTNSQSMEFAKHLLS